MSILIYSKNNPAKYHREPIWNDRALGFFEEGRPNISKKKNSAERWVGLYEISFWSNSWSSYYYRPYK